MIGGKEACFINPDPMVTLTHSATPCSGGKGWVCLQNKRCLPSRRWVLEVDSTSGLGQASLGKNLEGALMCRKTFPAV